MDDLATLAWVFLRLGLLAFGGGTAILPEMERQVVDIHGWLTPEQFVDSFALGQLTPGPALLMVMVAGYAVAGPAGAVVALVAIFAPSAALMAAVVANWHRLRGSPWLVSFRRAVAAVTLGLVAAGSYSIVRIAVTDLPSALVAACAFVVLWRWKLHPALVILAGGLVAGAAGAWQAGP
jgi:chromate transporter